MIWLWIGLAFMGGACFGMMVMCLLVASANSVYGEDDEMV